MLRILCFAVLLVVSGCSISPFRSGEPSTPSSRGRTADTGGGPVVSAPAEVQRPAPEDAIEAPAPVQVPKERPRTPPATLSPTSRALVSQAQAQRKKGDLPGATVSLERALRIEPNNPLLWIEMGRLRMDQRNFPQAESMGRKALSMAVGDDRTAGRRLAADRRLVKARGKNPQVQAAYEKAKALETR